MNNGGGAMSARLETLNALRIWVEERRDAEVANRPDQNIHKRTIDDHWSQVARKLDAMIAATEPTIDADAAALWQLLDDIDTVDDAAKSDNAMYRRTVRGIAKKRLQFFESLDGQTLARTKERS